MLRDEKWSFISSLEKTTTDSCFYQNKAWFAKNRYRSSCCLLCGKQEVSFAYVTFQQIEISVEMLSVRKRIFFISQINVFGLRIFLLLSSVNIIELINSYLLFVVSIMFIWFIYHMWQRSCNWGYLVYLYTLIFYISCL